MTLMISPTKLNGRSVFSCRVSGYIAKSVNSATAKIIAKIENIFSKVFMCK